MEIKIKIKDLDPERTLNYFYEKCLDEPSLEEFEVEILGTNFKRIKKNQVEVKLKGLKK